MQKSTARHLIVSAQGEMEWYVRSTLVSGFDSMCSHLDRSEFTQFIDPFISLLKLPNGGEGPNAVVYALSSVIARMEMSDVLSCVQRLSAEIETEKVPSSKFSLLEALSAFSSRLDSSQASVLSERLFLLLEHESVTSTKSSLVKALSAFSSRLDSSQASALSERLFLNLERESDVILKQSLVGALCILSSCLEGQTFSKYASRVIMQVERESDTFIRAIILNELSSFCSKIDMNDINVITKSWAPQQKFVDTIHVKGFVECMLIMSSRIEANDARSLARQVSRTLIETFRKYESDHRSESQSVRTAVLDAIELLLAHYESPELTLEMASLLCSGAVDDSNADQLRGLIAPITPQHAARNLLRLSIAEIQFGTSGAIDCVIREAGEVVPCRLKTQEIVELLKMPTVVGKTRRMLLDQLEGIHGRRFANHWEFVRFAQETGLKLDFTSPPRRPDPKVSVGKSLEGLSK